MKTLFITATGTDIGKTYVTAALARGLTAKGTSVRVLKPVITGFDEAAIEGAIEGTDTAVLLAAAGLDANKDAINACSPWRFTEPLSPDMAARRGGLKIDFDELVTFCRDAQDGGEDVLLIEGIGGVMVPLDSTDDSHTVLDWIEAAGQPALLIAGSYLGTLSHTLTAVQTLQHRNIEIAGVIIAESEESPVPLAETVETLKRHLGNVAIATVARNAEPEDVLAAVAGITEL